MRLRPDYAEAHYNLGSVLADQGDVAGAILEYREASRLLPNDPNPYYHLGRVLMLKGDYDDAIAEFEMAVQLKPDFVLADVELARCKALKDRQTKP